MKEETNINNTKAPDMPKPRKKRKKELIVPSQIIRYFMIAVYAAAVFLLTSKFISTTFYVTEDLQVSPYKDKAYTAFATQEEIDKAAEELEAAINSLEKSSAPVSEYKSTLPLESASFRWLYYASEDVETRRLRELINTARDIDRRHYTEESVKKLNDATLKAQKTLCAQVTVSQSAIQLMVSGSLSTSYGEGNEAASIGRYILIYALALLPVGGFFFATFDKRRHLKNIYAASCAILCITDIFMLIYPFIAIGSVLSIFAYLLLLFLAALGFYAKQQEDYIVAHPEEEAEFSEKHPYFVKALINHKLTTVPEMSKKEQAFTSAQNAKKRGRSRKK